MTDKRYSPQQVKRYRKAAGDEEGMWILVASYDDATVRDQGKGGWLRADQAMLRAYSNDPNFFGNQEYQDGNCIAVCMKGEMKGWVIDCDSDVALKRIMMNVVISMHNYGDGELEYIGFVSRDHDHTADYHSDPDNYTGMGYYDDYRVERWLASFHDKGE